MDLRRYASFRVGFFSFALLVGCSGGSGVGSTAPGTGSPVPTGARATVTWVGTNTYDNQACANDLAGYTLYAGTSSGVYSRRQVLPARDLVCTPNGQANACGAQPVCSYTLESLSPGAWYFMVAAYDATGAEGASSSEFAFTVD
jgi:hypothetical protein